MTRYQETLYSEWGQNFEQGKTLFEAETDHQHLIIFDNPRFGRVMALDGVIQTTEADEFVYHEMMVHVPMNTFSQFSGNLRRERNSSRSGSTKL